MAKYAEMMRKAAVSAEADGAEEAAWLKTYADQLAVDPEHERVEAEKFMARYAKLPPSFFAALPPSEFTPHPVPRDDAKVS
jgi:hypothetical protein